MSDSNMKLQVFIGLLGLTAIIQFAFCLLGSLRWFTAVPIHDAWSAVIAYARIAEGDYSAWWEQHNEHRIALTRALFWLDFSVFQGKGVFLIVCNYGLLFATFWILCHYLKERLINAQDALCRFSLAIVVFTLLYSWVQKENIIWTFQSQFFLASLLPLLAFYSLHKAYCHQRYSTLFYSLACLLGLLTLGGMANGIVLLPLLALMAMLLRMSYLRIGFLLLLAVVGSVLYFSDYQAPVSRDTLPETLVMYPLALMRYVIAYLGAPLYLLTGSRYYWLADLAGLGFLISGLVMGYQIVTAQKRDSLSFALLGFIVFVFGTAVGTGGGRVEFGITQALTSRYTTPVLQAWSVFVVYYAPMIAKGMRHYPFKYLTTLLSLQLLLLIPQTSVFESYANKLFGYRVAMLAAVMQIKDQQQIQEVFTAPEPIMLLAGNVTTRDLAFFNSPELQEVKRWNRSVDSTIAKNTCAGSLDSLKHLNYDESYVSISGWLFNQNNKLTPATVRILNAEREVIGYALSGISREDVKRVIAPEAGFSGFKGYVSSRYIGKTIVLQGVGVDCELAVSASKNRLVLEALPGKVISHLNRKPASFASLLNFGRGDNSSNPWLVNQDNTVTDQKDNLQWKQCVEGQAGMGCEIGKARRFSYQEAIMYTEQLNTQLGFAGYNNWRLPTLSELRQMRGLCKKYCGSSVFPNAELLNVWFNSSANYYGYYDWDVLFLKGYAEWREYYYQRDIRLVRTIEGL